MSDTFLFILWLLQESLKLLGGLAFISLVFSISNFFDVKSKFIRAHIGSIDIDNLDKIYNSPAFASSRNKDAR
jgi:hypothetical protein